MVSCQSDTVRKRVEAVLDMAITTVSSLTESFIAGVSMAPEDADPKQEKDTRKEKGMCRVFQHDSIMLSIVSVVSQ